MGSEVPRVQCDMAQTGEAEDSLTSVNRLKEKVHSLTTGNRSKSVKATINALTPVLCGWISYFRLTEVRGVLEELDGWIKRKLRCLL